MLMIDAHSLGKTYDNGVVALRDLDLGISQGEIFGFLGANGAGKSTTVRLLNGTLRPSGGTARVLDKPADDPAIRSLTASMGETAQMYDSLSAEDNLLFFAAMYGISQSEARPRIAELLERMHLAEKSRLKLGSFSTGMKKRVQLVRVLLHRPRLLFLDEPTSGLDPESAREVTALIREVAREQGSTVFLCTHNLTLAEQICDRYGFIHQGKLVRTGTKAELVAAAGHQPRLTVRTTREELSFPLDPAAPGINAILAELMSKGHTILEAVVETISLEELYFEIAGVKA